MRYIEKAKDVRDFKALCYAFKYINTNFIRKCIKGQENEIEEHYNILVRLTNYASIYNKINYIYPVLIFNTSMSFFDKKFTYDSSIKKFICNNINSYGLFDCYSALNSLYALNFNQLLPDAIIPLFTLINKMNSDMILKNKMLILIMLNSAYSKNRIDFVNNVKYDNAFLGILDKLIALNIPEAAIIKDSYIIFDK